MKRFFKQSALQATCLAARLVSPESLNCGRNSQRRQVRRKTLVIPIIIRAIQNSRDLVNLTATLWLRKLQTRFSSPSLTQTYSSMLAMASRSCRYLSRKPICERYRFPSLMAGKAVLGYHALALEQELFKTYLQVGNDYKLQHSNPNQ